MSMASPTLRSSSMMVPLPSFKSWLTSIPLLPSTALTVTGTSNTASRSAAECLGAVSAGPSALSSAAGTPAAASWLRSGRSTLSVAMGLSFHVRRGHVRSGHLMRETVGNKGGQRVFDDLFAALGAAAAPFDAAIGARHGQVGGDHHASLIALFMGDIGQARFQHLGNGGRGAQGDARLGDGLVHGLAQGSLDVAGGQCRQGGGGDSLGHGQRQVRGVIAQRLDFGMAGVQRSAHGNGQGGDAAFQGLGRVGLGVVLAFQAGEGLEIVQFLGGEGLLLARPGGRRAAIFGAGEFGIEGEAVRRIVGRFAHQYTSSSSAPPPEIMISPLLARSLATLTMRIWASSTSFRRTGPIASISSRKILPARSLMLEKKTSRSPSVAPFSARPSLSFSTLRSRVWIEPGSSLLRSSKVNISALMRSALSRERSSRAVMKRLSVWRSKLLKISAICSWASRLAVRARLDMNSTRKVCSTLSRISFCTLSIRSMRCTTSSANSSGREPRTRAACSGLILLSTTETVWGYSFLR